MRKIISKRQIEKKQKRSQIIVGLILVLVMLFSAIGYGFMGGDNSKENKINYNGFEFVKQGEFWKARIENIDFIFKYNPNQVNKISSQVNYLDSYFNKPLYILSENAQAEIEINKNLNQIVQRMQYACLNEENCEGNFPIKTCEDNFIIIKEGEGKIEQEGNCVFITGAQEDLVKLTDEFLFKILKIEQ